MNRPFIQGVGHVIDAPPNIYCWVCGSRLPEGGRETLCPSCSAPGPGDKDAPRFVCQSKIAQWQASKVISDWRQDLADHSIPGIVLKWVVRAAGGHRIGKLVMRGASHRFDITSCELRYAPFWKLTAVARGWVKGYRTEADGFETETVVPMDVIVGRSYEWKCLANRPGITGIESLDYYGCIIERCEPGCRPMPEVAMLPRKALAKGIARIRKMALRNSGIPHITSENIEVMPQQLVLMYYPLWKVTYSCSNRSYTATVDGVTGKLLPGFSTWYPILRLIPCLFESRWRGQACE